MEQSFTPNPSPIGQPDMAQLMRDFLALQARVATNEQELSLLRKSISGPRVRIQNFEGVFKVVSVQPSNSDDFQDGSVVLYDDGSSTRRIYAKMNKTWRFVAVT